MIISKARVGMVESHIVLNDCLNNAQFDHRKVLMDARVFVKIMNVNLGCFYNGRK